MTTSTSYAHHALALSYDYALPIGIGKYLLGSAGPWADKQIGGWQLVGVWRRAVHRSLSASTAVPVYPVDEPIWFLVRPSIRRRRHIRTGSTVVGGKPACFSTVQSNFVSGMPAAFTAYLQLNTGPRSATQSVQKSGKIPIARFVLGNKKRDTNHG